MMGYEVAMEIHSDISCKGRLIITKINKKIKVEWSPNRYETRHIDKKRKYIEKSTKR